MRARTWATLLMLLLATSAFAHSSVKSSVPANGSVLSASPSEIVINFSEPARLVSVIVTSQGAAERKLQFAPAAEAASFSVAAPKLASGRNEIKWHALSRDGHPISGTIILVVKPATAQVSKP